MRTPNLKFLALALGLSTSILFNPTFAASKMGGDSGGGGDASEIRVNEIRSDILKWINNDGANQLKLPNDLSYGEYSDKMTEILQPKRVVISFEEKEVSVKGIAKTCKGFISKSDSKAHILCNISRFKNTSESEQYKLIHHEFAGLVNVEKNEGAASDYSISSQITEKTFASSATDMQTVRYNGHSVKYGNGWRRRVSYIIPLTKACDNSDLESVLMKAQDDAIQKCEEDGAVECNILRGSSSTTNGDLGCAASVLATGKISKAILQQRSELELKEKAQREARKEAEVKAQIESNRISSEQSRKVFESIYYLSQKSVTTVEQLEELFLLNSKIMDKKIILNFRPTFDCGPCNLSTPILEELAIEDDLRIINIAVSGESELASRFQITSVPTFIIWENGKEVGRNVGALSLTQFRTFVQKNK